LPAKKHTADLALIASRFSEALLQDSLRSKWWLSSKVEALTFTTTNFYTCQLNKNRLPIFRLKSENDYSEKSARKLHHMWMIL